MSLQTSLYFVNIKYTVIIKRFNFETEDEFWIQVIEEGICHHGKWSVRRQSVLKRHGHVFSIDRQLEPACA
jgi:hypothetical protein